MNFRKTVEERILFIFLTYDKELISDNTSINSFDVIRKHSLLWTDFSEKTHQDIFKAILNQMSQGLQRLDIASLVQYRPQEYKTFDQQLNQFYSLIVNLKNTSFAAFSELDGLIYKLKEMVLSDFWKNKAQQIMSTSLQTIDVISFGETIVNEYSGIYNRMTSGIVQSDNNASEMTNHLVRKMTNAQQGIIGGIPIPVNSIHKELFGWNEPDLIIIGARPSMGKTQTGLGFAKGAADAGYPVVYISIEMSKMQLVNKIIASETGISTEKIKHGTITPQEFAVVQEYYRKIDNSNLNILPSKFRNLETLVQKARELHKRGKIRMLVIDYLQLMTTSQKYGTRDQMIGILTGDLKALALELNIPIIVLCQLNRGAHGNKPKLTDLRESGNIEQDADIVAIIHRPSFYQENYADLPYHEQFKTEFHILKNRGGKLSTPKYFIDVEQEKLFDVQY